MLDKIFVKMCFVQKHYAAAINDILHSHSHKVLTWMT